MCRRNGYFSSAHHEISNHNLKFTSPNHVLSNYIWEGFKHKNKNKEKNRFVLLVFYRHVLYKSFTAAASIPLGNHNSTVHDTSTAFFLSFYTTTQTHTVHNTIFYVAHSERELRSTIQHFLVQSLFDWECERHKIHCERAASTQQPTLSDPEPA